ncbi:MAG: hypothetical protein SFU20_08120 [Chitinophagaceae bacterium]|nr:hypothetical protein [Chitinophagaceae bacterium]
MIDLRKQFFDFWCISAEKKQFEIMANCNYESNLSSIVMYDDDAVLVEIARSMGLSLYHEYYRLDAVLFNDATDKVPNCPKGQTWLSTIQIAFEHENYINSGLFQEVSHLMITDCNLGVLVTYPNTEDEIKREIKILHKLISDSLFGKRTIRHKNILLIFGWQMPEKLIWFACSYEANDWEMLNDNIDLYLDLCNFQTNPFSIHK